LFWIKVLEICFSAAFPVISAATPSTSAAVPDFLGSNSRYRNLGSDSDGEAAELLEVQVKDSR
jgi:hypothetical protein